jgi:DNA polymerase-1
VLGHTTLEIKSLIGTGQKQITFDLVPIQDATPYAAEDADVTLRLAQILKPRLAQSRVCRVYETLERPLIPVLAMMERTGFKVDKNRLATLSSEFEVKIYTLEKDIHELAGETFNVGSPKQLGEILFDKMGIPGGKKGKTGAYATGADVLEHLSAQGHILAERVLEWRQLAKLKSTYTDALQKQINPETGRVHTSFSLAATTTGRLASTEPNLQNIPIRTEEGRKIREAFVVEERHTLLSLDYSQIELRILADIADVPALTQAFKDGIDIHAMTASAVFGVPIEGMDPMVRRQAKAINFGVIYGISSFGLANQLGISQGEAKAFIDAYFAKFPGIQTYMQETKEFAQEHGYVETLFGRRIHTPQINTKGPQAAFSARAAINAPIQGTAADIIRRAMIRIPPALEKEGFNTKMLLQVHDELLFETPANEVNSVINLLKNIMQQAALPVVDLKTSLVVEAGQGKNWAEAH